MSIIVQEETLDMGAHELPPEFRTRYTYSITSTVDDLWEPQTQSESVHKPPILPQTYQLQNKMIYPNASLNITHDHREQGVSAITKIPLPPVPNTIPSTVFTLRNYEFLPPPVFSSSDNYDTVITCPSNDPLGWPKPGITYGVQRS